ncbi:hypothetical protein E2C01_029142 [Portunus trituberculatus]|uniref:Uncharacterized protein n=1 Tax=Portunus trituberculatus TaxID=210409 RepID=A0A5B7EMK4_PORTR|nr:hypothetical protein [Portunus trituberculatus]
MIRTSAVRRHDTLPTVKRANPPHTRWASSARTTSQRLFLLGVLGMDLVSSCLGMVFTGGVSGLAYFAQILGSDAVPGRPATWRSPQDALHANEFKRLHIHV